MSINYITPDQHTNAASPGSAETDVDLPVDVVWEMWRDRTSIPNWMPWISSVDLIPEDESLSRWVLSTNQFGRDWTFSWIAKDLTPVKFQKVGAIVLSDIVLGVFLDVVMDFCVYVPK